MTAVELRRGIIARGPWPFTAVRTRWQAAHFVPSADVSAAADDAISALAERGSPSHDGLGARLVDWSVSADGLQLDLQPIRWALRLVPGDACASLSSHLVVRDAAGRWLAGRRAAWLSSWAGHWSLGAGGAVDVGESPTETLTRELREEWSTEAERVEGAALLRLPNLAVMFVGQAWLPDGAVVVPDAEHDAHAWWPRDPAQWPPETSDQLRRTASIILAAEEML